MSGGESVSETKNYEKIVDEKIEKFVAEFHSPASQFWGRLLLRRLVRADITNNISGIVQMFNAGVVNIDSIAEESSFDFNGEEAECELARMGIPHAPHLVGSYMTVRYGAMDYYCLGRPGYITLWDYTIHVQINLKRHRGGAHGKVRVEVKA